MRLETVGKEIKWLKAKTTNIVSTHQNFMSHKRQQYRPNIEQNRLGFHNGAHIGAGGSNGAGLSTVYSEYLLKLPVRVNESHP